MGFGLKIRVIKALMPYLLAGFYLFLLLYQADRVAITDDAQFYMDAAKSYENYFEDGWKRFEFYKQNYIDRYWEKNHEHPPFAKLLMAGGYFVFYKKLKLINEIFSYRIGISILAAITLLFIFSFVRRAVSFNAAVFASLFFIFLPRIFFDARVATLDFTVAATSFIFVYCYWRGLESKKWAWLTGVAFGFAISSKLNAPFMVVPVLIHYLWVKREEFSKKPIRTLFAPQFVSMLLFSLPIFLLMWPWLWHATIPRITEYIKFHINHYGILMYYLGGVYSNPRPPWHAPLVMMAATTPMITILFAILSFYFYRWKNEAEKFSPILLTILCAFVSIGALMFMPAPFYSGVKLFLPFFPFLAVLAGVGLYYMLKNATLLPVKYKFAPFFVFFMPVIFSMIDLRHDHLSYYSEAIGGTKGALKYKLEQHYYDLFYLDMADYFNRELKSFTAVAFDPNGKEYPQTARILKDSKLLTNNFYYSDNKDSAYFVLTHEYRWNEYPDLLRKNKWRKPDFILKRQGVPLLNIYKKKPLIN